MVRPGERQKGGGMKTTDGNAVVTRVVTTGDESPESRTLTRLDSWKDIAHYLNRNVRTVQRWEMREAMPVHRHCHDTGHSVYAYRQEIDAWRSNRSQEKRPTLRVSVIRRTPLGLRTELRTESVQGASHVGRCRNCFRLGNFHN